MFFELVFDSEEDSSIDLFLRGLGIGKGEFKGEEFDSGFFHILREAVARAWGIDPALGAQVILR